MTKVTVPKLMTPKEYADYYRVTERTVYRWIEREAVIVKRVKGSQIVRIVVDDDDDKD